MVHVEHSISTVPGNRNKFTQCDASTADIARRFQHIAGHPNNPTLVAMATKRTTRNCLLTPRNVTIATKILGPSVYVLKGKCTRKTKEAVQTEALVPKTIKEHYMELTIAAGVLQVNQIHFSAQFLAVLITLLSLFCCL